MTKTTSRSLHHSSPRPRARVRHPAYPRQLACIGIALSIAAGCGGTSPQPEEPITAGGIAEPYVEPTPIATEPPPYADPPPEPVQDPDPDENIQPPGGPAAPYQRGN